MAAADVDMSYMSHTNDISASGPVAPNATGPAPAQRDELDDLFNYDAQIDNVFRDVDPNTRPGADEAEEEINGLGIDEEIKVRKKRAPVAKLDEDRLLGQNGITKLRSIAKTKMKFKGKGHEFSDVAHLLSVYQLWLDDMFPKAKFADGLAIIEKLGHKRRLKVMRQAWIDEAKPKPIQPDESDPEDDFVVRGTEDQPAVDEDEDALFVPQDPVSNERLLVQGESSVDQEQAAQDEVPELDDLDALIAEDQSRRTTTYNATNTRQEFDDDEEAMAGIW